MPNGLPARDPFRWKILGLIGLSHIIAAAAQYGINTLAPFYKDELELSRAQVGLFFSAFYLAMTGASFGSGWLADRFGVRATTALGHAVVGVCIGAAALAWSFEIAFASFFLAGLGYSFLNPASTIGVMSWFRSDERATAMGVKQTGVPAGGVLAAILAPSLVLLIGWRGALGALGIVNFAFGFLFARLWREPREAASDVRLARPRHALEDQLPLEVEEGARAAQPLLRQQRVAAEVGLGVVRAWPRPAAALRQQRQRVGLDGARVGRQKAVER